MTHSAPSSKKLRSRETNSDLQQIQGKRELSSNASNWTRMKLHILKTRHSIVKFMTGDELNSIPCQSAPGMLALEGSGRSPAAREEMTLAQSAGCAESWAKDQKEQSSYLPESLLSQGPYELQGCPDAATQASGPQAIYLSVNKAQKHGGHACQADTGRCLWLPKWTPASTSPLSRLRSLTGEFRTNSTTSSPPGRVAWGLMCAREQPAWRLVQRGQQGTT